MFKSIFPYLVLILAVICGTASNSFANSANGFTKLVPSIYSIITIILCMYLLSQVMKFLPVGITYATFAGLCIIGTSFVGIIKFSQIPSFSTIIGLMLIISGVLIVNLLGNDHIWITGLFKKLQEGYFFKLGKELWVNSYYNQQSYLFWILGRIFF